MSTNVVPTGIAGLDYALAGGLPCDRLYLVQGDPGAGKTTLALQYLLEGRRRGERGLYISLGETAEELRQAAESHGWDLEGIELFELNEMDSSVRGAGHYTLFHPSEVELTETATRLMEAVDRLRPTRLVLDSLSELRLLARDPLRYRRQILALKQFFVGKQCTVLMLDDGTSEAGDLQLQSIAHGVLVMQHLSPEYGAERRRLRIVKLRGVRFRGGFHDFTIERGGGVKVFPRLVAADHDSTTEAATQTSGIPELDALCGGGLDRGSSTLLLGPAGTGKSTLASQFIATAAARGERGAIFTFDESASMMCARARSLGLGLDAHVQAGRVTVKQVDPAELSPGQFADLVKSEVDRGARNILVDSLNGYLNAMPEERFLVIQMHELLSFLGQKGVSTLLTIAQHGLLGDRMASPVDLSYLADTVLLLRHFEAAGEIRKAISVLKRRRGAHEKTIRELRMSSSGIALGPPLADFSGVLTGVPHFRGEPTSLIAGASNGDGGR